MTTRNVLTLTALCVALAQAQPTPQVFSASGPSRESIQAVVDSFRAELGPVNPPGAAQNPNGRREVNWDGVPDTAAAPNNFPPDFFNKNSARGIVYTGGQGVNFMVSASEAAGPVRFDNLNPSYSGLFKTFSGQRLFVSTGANTGDVEFFVPGTETCASVNAFGAVFTNVAVGFASTIEFFTPDGVSLGKFHPAPAPQGLSFLGVAFKNKVVSRVRITTGTTGLGPAEDLAKGINAVALDDFIYGEPEARSTCISPAPAPNANAPGY